MVLPKMLCRISIDEEQVVGYLFGAYSKSTRMRRSRHPNRSVALGVADY